MDDGSVREEDGEEEWRRAKRAMQLRLRALPIRSFLVIFDGGWVVSSSSVTDAAVVGDEFGSHDGVGSNFTSSTSCPIVLSFVCY